MIANIGQTIEKLKPKLREYLVKKKTRFNGKLFQCPNRDGHTNQDMKPSCNFYPNEESFKCFACFTEDNDIKTKDGVKSIKDITLQDRILTSEGKYRKIKRTFTHSYRGNVYKIKAGICGELKATHNHRFFVVPQKKVRNKYIREYEFDLIKAEDLKKGDYLASPLLTLRKLNKGFLKLPRTPHIKTPIKIKLDEKFFYFLGLYLAEGNTCQGRTVVLAFHENEIYYQNWVQNYLRELGINSRVCSSIDGRKAVTVYGCYAPLAKWLDRFCKRGALNKKIPTRFFGIEKKYTLEILRGLFDGDGSRGNNYSTISKTLAQQVFLLASSLYLFPSCYTSPKRTGKDGVVHQESYVVHLGTKNFNAKFDPTKTYKTNGLYIINGMGSFYLRRISKITFEEKQLRVYNLEIPKIHNYVVNCVLVKNCQASGDLFTACNLLEGRPVKGIGFHETTEYLCQLLDVPFLLSDRDSNEVEFIQGITTFLESLATKGHETMKILTDGNEPTKVVQFLKDRGWRESIEDFRLGTMTQVKSSMRSEKISSFCDFLNLNLRNLVGNIIIPVYHKHKAIGFQIRYVSESAPTKYSTHLITGKCLYNLDTIDTKQPVYLVEGASSVIYMRAKGIKNVVASLGSSLSTHQYEALVSRGVKKLIVLYDADAGGNEGRTRICNLYSNRTDIEIVFRLLPEKLDPADYLAEHDSLDELEELSFWDYLTQDGDREAQLKYVARQEDLITKEQLIGKLAKLWRATKQTIIESVKKYESSTVSTARTIQEKENLIEAINVYEKWAWSRGELLGLRSYKCFDSKLDGLQEGLVLVDGDPNIGKTALCVSLVLKLIEKNKNVYVIHFSVDDSMLISLSRYLANVSSIPINSVNNPKYKIMNNPNLSEEQKKDFALRRDKALEYMRQNVSMFNLKDASDGYTIEYIQDVIRVTEPLFRDKELIIVVDNLHKLRSEKGYRMDKGLVDLISAQLKLITGKYRCPVICTAEKTKDAIKEGKIGGNTLKETSCLHYDANLILSLTTKQVVSDTINLLDVVVTKNKFSSFIGTLGFRFYKDLSKVSEVDNTLENGEEIF